MGKPNLFRYATKELSQDAVICWLIDWSAHDHDHELRQLGRHFVESLLSHKQGDRKVNVEGGIQKVEVLQQEKNIDVLARINGSQVLLIEDKTHSEPHGDQLATYKRAVLSNGTSLGEVSEEDLFAIYFKTGNHSLAAEQQIENDTGYKVFDRADFRAVLSRYRGDNAIVSDFSHHLDSIENQTQSFRKWRRSDSDRNGNWFAWEGLYRTLEKRLFDAGSGCPWSSGWGYVPNPSGGFLGFWWSPAGLPEGHCAYLQLEMEKLCFKVGTDSSLPEEQDQLKWKWHQRITAQHDRVSKPNVMRRGATMTVAIHEDGWLRYDGDGILSLDDTVESLRQAEQVLLAAATRTDGRD